MCVYLCLESIWKEINRFVAVRLDFASHNPCIKEGGENFGLVTKNMPIIPGWCYSLAVPDA